METIKQFLGNSVLMPPIFAWMLAQILKTLLNLVTTRTLSLERLTGAGGMPSAHSALVCCMMICMARNQGVGSPLFALAVLFAAVVMYDAMSVRRAAGEHAKAINLLVDNVEKEQNTELMDKDLKEFLGHTPLEVLAGALLGIIVGMVAR